MKQITSGGEISPLVYIEDEERGGSIAVKRDYEKKLIEVSRKIWDYAELRFQEKNLQQLSRTYWK